MPFYRPIIREYGMWDQLRVDQGREWTLMLFMQEQLAHFRFNSSRAPHLQSSSKQVHVHSYLDMKVLIVLTHSIESYRIIVWKEFG